MDSENEKEAPPTRRETLLPALAVAAVAVVAVFAAVMVQRAETHVQRQATAESASRPAPGQSPNVVQAPPLTAPTQAMGSGAPCKQCGVVQTVVAVFDEGGTEPRGYQMHIRMDDGTLRTVEQRGALAAGSRVVVDGKSVRPLS